MVILGIDSGFKNTGVALVDTNAKYIATRTIKSDFYTSYKTLHNKYTIMRALAYDVLDFLEIEASIAPKRLPQIVVAENSISRFPSKAISELTETRAVILAIVGHFVVKNYHAEVVQVSNMTVKKFFFGKDAEHPVNKPTKKEMIALMQHRHKIKPAADKKREKTEHEYDAIALCDWYVSTH